VTRSGKTFTKTGGTNGQWDASVRSVEGFASCAVSFVPAQTNRQLAIGLNTDPATDNDVASIDYGWYLHLDGNCSAIENGSLVPTTLHAYSSSTVLSPPHDGHHARYGSNNSLVRSVAMSGLRLYLDSSIYGSGGAVHQLIFQEGAIGKIDLSPQVSGILS